MAVDLVVEIFAKYNQGCSIGDLRDIPNKFVGFELKFYSELHKCIEQQSNGDKRLKELLRRVGKFAER